MDTTFATRKTTKHVKLQTKREKKYQETKNMVELEVRNRLKDIIPGRR